jgi:hypothetical protein
MRLADGTEPLSGEWGEVGSSSEGLPLVSVGVSVGLGQPDTMLEGVLVAGRLSIVSAVHDGRVAYISMWYATISCLSCVSVSFLSSAKCLAQ